MEEMKSNKQGYLFQLIEGILSLLTGLRVTLIEFFTRKTTQCYPENRLELRLPDRFRGTLEMSRAADGALLCTACGLCALTCPNDTIHITSESVTDENGKKRRVLIRYDYDLSSCLFCQLCVNACPASAIHFTPSFEHAVFTKSKLLKTLNK